MKLMIKGHFSKINGHWVATVPILGLSIKMARLSECLQSFSDLLKKDSTQSDLNCTLKISNDQIFYLVVPHCEAFTEYLSQKMLESQNPEGWEEMLRSHITFEELDK